ncbi:HAMP domain-containing sensor histidine kinase [Engelhardtia mirabilis]|uniref:histidine kinase n=1 Tax=Engelhardtia mirabilis TaxID=2528011 RepID=A0A518BDG5_9BACT|nr:Sensor kinase CusS [Planctomycetes bacterium Pla133]QDU99340.1 Sensor kinase CusS [Planctomycetes bacterium Pla86]
MRNSLRWTLIGWFGAILALAVAAFGSVLYLQVSESGLRSVEVSLAERAQALAAALEYDARDGWELELSEDYLRGLTQRCSFRIVTPAGEVIAQGGGAQWSGAMDTPSATTGEPASGVHGDSYHFTLVGPGKLRVVLRSSIEPQQQALAELRLQLLLVGVAILAGALLGGLWLARRVLRPIAGATRAAAAIDASDLSKRLDVAAMPLELRELGTTFNGTLDRLEEAFGRLTRFTADASHELRTPLAVLRTEVELALRRNREPDEYREALRTGLRAVARMTELVDGLMVLAKADAGSADIERTRVELGAAATEAVEALGARARAQSIEIHSEGNAVQVRGDRALLREAIENLLSNAVRYNEPGGRVDVAVRSEGGQALVSVRDDGPGIPADSLDRLFDRFYRVDEARSRAQGGSGLGLSIVRWIAEAHGGTVDVASSPGEGSTFTLRLPLVDGAS